jgi:hypothetical protein
MTRYRRRELTGRDRATAAVASALVGIGTAAVAFYITRILLAREPLAGSGGREVKELGPSTPDGEHGASV